MGHERAVRALLSESRKNAILCLTCIFFIDLIVPTFIFYKKFIIRIYFRINSMVFI
jgi:hypothetical protein